MAFWGLRPPNLLIRKVLNYYVFFLGGRPSNFGKKIKRQEENLGKFHKNSRASEGFAPRTPWSDRNFNYSYIFDQIRAKSSMKIWKMIKVINFTWLILTNLLNFFNHRGAPPRTTIIACVYNIHIIFPIVPPDNFKRFRKNCIFLEFPNNFSNVY